MALLVSPVRTESLSLTPELSGGVLKVYLKGNADSASNDAFGAFVTKLHPEAQRLAVKQVQVDLTQLYFMTSTCIKSFIAWLGFIKSSPQVKQYTLNFIVNPNLRWQKRTLDVLLQLTDLATLTEASR